jgi:sec-independent protein translocase protein TatB
MFDVASSEVILLGVVALLVIPPKDLPKAMRFAGHWVGKVRGVANQFRSGFDTMVREAELQEMEKKWAAENERIMREHPPEPSQRAALSGHPDHAADVGYDGTEGDAPPMMVETPALTAPPVIAEPAGPGAHDAAPHAAEPETKAHP